MIKNYSYTYTDGVAYQIVAHYDENPSSYTPPGYQSILREARLVGCNQTVDVGRYTSKNSGSVVYTLLFEAREDVDSYWGYTIMTADPRAEQYTEQQQNNLVVAVHQYVRLNGMPVSVLLNNS